MVTKADLTSGLAAVRAELATVEARLETKIEQARSDTIKRVVGVAFAQAAMIFAMFKFFPAGHP
jgi:hydrogenase/urease accessory protein HupE